MVHGGHVHEVSAGEGDVGRYARALRADGFLRHLHEYLLAFLEKLLDAQGGSAPPSWPAALLLELDHVLFFANALFAHHLGVLVHGVVDVGDVEEGGLLKADVHERGLHARQHLHHPALVDVAGVTAVLRAFDEYLCYKLVLEERDAGLLLGRVHNNLSSHMLLYIKGKDIISLKRFF